MLGEPSGQVCFDILSKVPQLFVPGSKLDTYHVVIGRSYYFEWSVPRDQTQGLTYGRHMLSC